MPKLYFIILCILPILITSESLLDTIIAFYHVSKDTINNDIQRLKIKLGIAKKNLILGSIEKLNWKDIKPFLKSLKQVKFNYCDVVMFVKDISNDVQQKLKLYEIIQKEVPDEYKSMSISDARFVLYEQFLKDKYKEYDMIIAVDVKDLIFQKDIFQYYKKYKSFLSFAVEEGDLTEENTKRWITRVYGNEVYESIKNQKIMSCGSIIGSSDKFYELVVDISKELKNKFSLNVGVHDQPVLNFFYYYEKKYNKNIIISDSFGPLMSIGTSKRENLSFDSDGNLLNKKGEIVGLVHHYDNFKDIAENFREKYGNLIVKVNNGDDNNNMADNKNNLFSIYFIIIILFLFMIYIIVVLCINIIQRFKKKPRKSNNAIKYKNVKIEKLVNSQKNKSKGKYIRIQGLFE